MLCRVRSFGTFSAMFNMVCESQTTWYKNSQKNVTSENGVQLTEVVRELMSLQILLGPFWKRNTWNRQYYKTGV